MDNGLIEDSPVIRSAVCIVNNGTDPLALLKQLPKNIETITLIQGYKSGNKTVKISDFEQFQQLISLELIGMDTMNKNLTSYFVCQVDNSIKNLKYLNLERVLVKNSIQQIQKFVHKLSNEEFTFEYVVQNSNINSHPLTILRKGRNEEILPYNKFKMRTNLNDVPLFTGFDNLNLLRIADCDLKSVYWEMFDGLNNLNYLILERNNLRFIPEFAFYGTPNLKTLSLAYNNLLNIELTDLAGLFELEYLDLSYNNFSQLSELSLPPFPKLKLANFANNPINIIFPNTFEVMNTTNSIIVGSEDMALTLLTNSFVGLDLLKKLTINNLYQNILTRDLFRGMPNLLEFVLTGNITQIEFDAFLDLNNLNTLILSQCKIRNISMDAFIGLNKLHYLDLSGNNLEYLPPGVFDHLVSIKEIYLNNNFFKELSTDIFSRIHPKLLRLNDNPWHCSCHMSDWKPMIVNRIKQRISKPCEMTHDKGVSCRIEQNKFLFKYTYDNKVAPKCVQPTEFQNWNVFHAMRKIFKCKNYKPKFKKYMYSVIKMKQNEHLNITKAENIKTKNNYNNTILKTKNKFQLQNSNELQYKNKKLYTIQNYNRMDKLYLKKKYKTKKQHILDEQNNINNFLY